MMDVRQCSEQIYSGELSKVADIVPAKHHIQLATQYLNFTKTQADNVKSDNHGHSHDTTLAYFEHYINHMSNIVQDVRKHFIDLLDEISTEQGWFAKTDYDFLRRETKRSHSIEQPLVAGAANQIELGNSKQSQSNDTFNDNDATELKTLYNPHDYLCNGRGRRVSLEFHGQRKPSNFYFASDPSDQNSWCVCERHHGLHAQPRQNGQHILCNYSTLSEYNGCSMGLDASSNHSSQPHGPKVTVRQTSTTCNANTYLPVQGGARPRTRHISLNDAPGSAEKPCPPSSTDPDKKITGVSEHNTCKNSKSNSNHLSIHGVHNTDRSRLRPQSSQSLPAHLEGKSLQEGKLGIKIFITYSRDNKRHIIRILDLVDWLRKCGFHACIDMADKLAMATDIHGWIEEKFTMVDYILVICSPKYLQDTGVVSEPSEIEHHGLHTRFIHRLMQTKYTSNACKNYRFIPVVLENSGGTRANVPQWLHNTMIYEYPSKAGDLYFRLRIKRMFEKSSGIQRNLPEE